MADAQITPATSAPATTSSQRGRRGRPGRGRGRGSNNRGSGHGRGGHVPPSSGVATPVTTNDAAPAAPAAPAVPVVQQRPSVPAEPRASNSRGRGDRRGGRQRGRAGRAAPGTHMAPRRAFGGQLTSAAEEGTEPASPLSGEAPAFVPGQPVPHRSRQPPKSKTQATPQPRARRASKSEAPDLMTRIHEDINNGQYECVICSSEVVRSSRIWACTTCWTVVHHHCTRKWYKSQMDGEHPQVQEPTWRCPGCNSKLTEEPGTYHCWCGKEINPRATPGTPPHSCGQTCSKPRGTCPHPCPMQCHSGPCPPCTLMGPVQSCYCGKHTSQKRCIDTDYSNGYSCNEVCGDLLPCGDHTCAQTCHQDLCGACEVPVPSTCYCGKEFKEILCDKRDDILESYNYGQLKARPSDDSDATAEAWFEGSFICNQPCGRKYDCDFHACEKTCHPQDEGAAHCPLSPDVVTHCPCGKTLLDEIMEEPRQSCQDKIEHCKKVCGKNLDCGHKCQDTCHIGNCKSCFQKMEVSCQCGRTTVESTCQQVAPEDVQKPMCFRNCRALLSCGRHQCDSRCCPGEKRASKRQANKRKAGTANEDVEDEHICPRMCGRRLKCGQHFCEQLCHKGPCPSCLEAIFDEISCACGRTVLYPPQPCGTQPPQCRFPCTRARTCGHPQVEHQCHPDDVDCPKCPFLVEKRCICGKEVLKNQPCWFEEPRCGQPCGKLLKCGLHACQKLCHRPGECEDAGIPGSHCSQPCGRARKSCPQGHECIDECHAPNPCNEDRPCQSETFLTCDCQRRKQKVKCLSTRVNPEGPQRESLKCDDECSRQKRNRQLAEALNVDTDHTDNHVPYQDLTLKLFRDHVEWAETQEREFRVFADSNLRNMRFKPMKGYQRQFLHVLAEDFGLDSESQDPDPHRHVSIFKGPRFVCPPKKTLMQCLRILRKATPARAAAPPPAANKPAQHPYNALLLSQLKFGLTLEELDAAVAADCAAAIPPEHRNSVTFTTGFLPTDEVLIKTTTKTTIASVASGTLNPAQLEGLLTALKPKVAKAVAGRGLAGGVTLCAVDVLSSSSGVVRREGDGSGGAGGWSMVARGAAARPRQWAAAPVLGAKPPGTGFLALRRLGAKKVEVKEEPVVAEAAGAPAEAEAEAEEKDGERSQEIKEEKNVEDDDDDDDEDDGDEEE